MIRLIDEESPQLFNLRASLPWQVDVIREWDFRDPVEVRSWRVNSDRVESEASESGLRLTSRTVWVALSKRVDFEADQVQAVEVDLGGDRASRLLLQWAGPGQRDAPERQSEIVIEASSVGSTTFRFELQDQALWQGQVVWLRLGIVAPRGETFLVRQIRAIRSTLDVEALAELSTGPYKVEIDRELRNAHLALPGRALELELTVGDAQTLSFAVGTTTTTGEGFKPRVEWTGTAGETTTLFEPSGPISPETWQDVEIDLNALAGQTGRLRFIADGAPSSPDPVLGFWAHPEVRSRGQVKLPNVVLISIDTLRADHLSLYGYPRETSPHLDRFAQERGVTFENTVAASSSTKIAHTSIFSGLDAHRHGVQHHRTPSNIDLLAEFLRARGYATQAITGGAQLHPSFGLAQGFDRYRYFHGEPEDEIDFHLPLALDALDGLVDRPFFFFFHTYETHGPYRARPPYFDRFGGSTFNGRVSVDPSPTEVGHPSQWHWVLLSEQSERLTPWAPEAMRQLVIDRYDSAIAYTDARIARLLDRLDELGVLDNTWIVITSDHGEAFGEGGRIQHGFLDDSNLMIPLIIAGPGVAVKGGRVNQQVRSVDILPTLLEGLGLEIPPGLDGVSLFPFLEGRSTDVPETAWSYVSNSNQGLSLRLDNRLKYVFNESVLPHPESRETLFDLRRDADETNDLATSFDAARYRQLAVSQLRDKTPGLRLQLRNLGEAAFRLTLEGDAISATQVNSWDLPPRRVEDCCSGRLRIAVEPGDRFHLLIDAAPYQPFQMRLEQEEEIWRRDDFSLAADERLIVSYGSSSFAAKSSGSLPDIGFEMFWHGRVEISDTPLIDEELRGQLEALGYID